MTQTPAADERAPLDARTIVLLAELIGAVDKCQLIRRWQPSRDSDDGRIVSAKLRCFVTAPDGPSLMGDTDIRDSYIRVTSDGGFGPEVYWPVSEIIADMKSGSAGLN